MKNSREKSCNKQNEDGAPFSLCHVCAWNSRTPSRHNASPPALHPAFSDVRYHSSHAYSYWYKIFRFVPCGLTYWIPFKSKYVLKFFKNKCLQRPTCNR